MSKILVSRFFVLLVCVFKFVYVLFSVYLCMHVDQRMVSVEILQELSGLLLKVFLTSIHECGVF